MKVSGPIGKSLTVKKKLSIAAPKRAKKQHGGGGGGGGEGGGGGRWGCEFGREYKFDYATKQFHWEYGRICGPGRGH